MRIFVAINVDDVIKQKVAQAQQELKFANANVRWVAMENFHLTLHFCGEVDENKLAEILTTCKGIAFEFAPFTLEIKYLGSFPPYGEPRVIWTGVEKGREEAITLIEVTKRHLALVTGNTEKKDITPHLTIGRIKNDKNIGVLTTRLHKMANLGFGQQTVSSIVVMKSKLGSSGPQHSMIEEIKLGGCQKS